MNICVFASIPPPMVGSSQCVQYLLECDLDPDILIHHIDTSLNVRVDTLGVFSLKKIFQSIKLFFNLATCITKNNCVYTVITPAFKRIPFIRDSIAIFTAVFFGSKVILWIHANNFKDFYDDASFFYKIFIKIVLNRADFIVSIGNAIENSFNSVDIKAKKVIIPNAIPHIYNNSEVNKAGDSIRVLWLSNMLKEKGWEWLLKSASDLVNLYNVEFIFAGAPSNDSPIGYIETAFKKHSSHGRIKYLGPIYGAEKENLFSSADIFCLPTCYSVEAFPLVLLEAMRAGLPVISTAIGAIPEVIINNAGGIILDGMEQSELSNALENLITDCAARKSYGEFNKNRFLTYYSLQSFARRWNEIFLQ